MNTRLRQTLESRRIWMSSKEHENYLKNISQLLRQGADVNFGFTIAGKRGITPLMIAARYDSPEAIQILLDHGADPNQADETGKTPLMDAINTNFENSVYIATLLVRAGANINQKNNFGYSALGVAAGKGSIGPVNTKMIAFLLEQGADVPLDMKVRMNADKQVRVMIQQAKIKKHQLKRQPLMEKIKYIERKQTRQKYATLT